MAQPKAFLKRIQLPAIILGLTATVLFFVLWNFIVVTIMPGERGVFYSRLSGGTNMNKVYDEGVHLKFPWDKMFIYNTRVQEIHRELDMLSSDGLSIHITVSCRFQVMRDLLPQLHTEIGPDYVRKIIYPSLVSAVRQAVGRYRPMELYSSARQELQDSMLVDALQEVSRVPVVLHNVLVKQIVLPETLNVAIEKKLQAEQDYQRYEYILKAAVEEARRKTIEGYGISRYQALVNENMTNDYLRLEGIQATKDLAGSDNAKMVVIGGGKDGLPVILNTADQNTSTVPKRQKPALKPNNPDKAVSSTATKENTADSPQNQNTNAGQNKEAGQDGQETQDSIFRQGELIKKLKYFDKLLLNPVKGN